MKKNRLLSKPYFCGELARRVGARILMYLRVHFVSALRVSSNSSRISRFGKKSNILWGCIVGLSIILASCSDKKTADNPYSHVDTATVYETNVPYVLNYPAMVQGRVDYPVVPRVSGVLYKQLYKEGTFVKKGQPLYQIDPRPFEWDLKSYQGQLIKDRAAEENYRHIYQRYEDLYQYKAVSKQDVENARIQYQAAVGNVKTDEANIEQMKLNLRYCLVRSPADGYIGERQVTVGTMVTAFQTQLNNINSVNQMYLLFSMPEDERLMIEDGVLNKKMIIPEQGTFRIDMELANGKRINNAGYVEFLDTRIATDNGAWSMRAYVDNRFLKNKLLSGQYVTVYLHGIEYLHVFRLPQEAVLTSNQGSFVYVVEKGIAHQRYVKTGEMLPEGQWMITKGLNNGEVVVISGNTRISDKQKVVIDKAISQPKPEGKP